MATANTAITWTSSKRGRLQHAYRDGRMIGYIERHDGPLGPAYMVTAVPERGPLKYLGSCGGGVVADAMARAKRWLIDVHAATKAED